MAYCGPRGIALDDFLRWSDRSQQAALDWMTHEARRCRSCGMHPDDMTDRHGFHAHLEQCKGCQAQQRVSDSNEARDSGRGVQAVTRPWPALACPNCQPLEDDEGHTDN